MQEHNGSAVGGRLLTLVSFQVSGRAEEKLDLIKFNTGQKYYLDNKWVGILQVKNTGNIDLELKGQIKVDGPFYKYFSNSVYLGNKLFVQSDRNLNINLSGNSKILWPGKYHAQVSVFYGLTKQTLMADLEFWYFPVWFLIVSGLILLFLLFNLVHKKIKNEVAV